MKPTILTTGDSALGLGDGFLLIPAILELSKTYKVRHIATMQSYQILKRFDDGDNIKIYNPNDQGFYYTNDHIEAYNLTYWSVRNRLRNLKKQALNICLNICDLPDYSGVLPDIPIDPKTELAIKSFFDQIKKPTVVCQPVVSFYNKMIPDYKQLKIVDLLLEKGYFVIQIGGNNIPDSMIHPKALSLVGKTTIDQSMAIIKYTDVYVGLDSFGQHCAGFAKTPSVIMWCGTSPCDFGYNYFSNIWHPDIVTCQGHRCGRPMRWLFDYVYKDPYNWNSREEVGWVCPEKVCEKAISPNEVVEAVDKEYDIGRNRDWNFQNITYRDGI